jgi:hypothetical protein
MTTLIFLAAISLRLDNQTGNTLPIRIAHQARAQ